LGGLEEEHRSRYLQNLFKVRLGQQYLHYLSSVDLDYPFIEQQSLQLSINNPIHRVNSSNTEDSTGESPLDFKDFLHRHYTRYLCDSGRPLIDPSWGLDPDEGLMSSQEIMRQCRFELEDLVQHYQRLADHALVQGLMDLRRRRAVWGRLMSGLFLYSRGLQTQNIFYR
jgi:hypothetical protein